MEQEGKNELKDLFLGGENAPKEYPLGLLQAKGLSVEKFARKSNLTRASVYYYLQDKRRPTLESVDRMARALEVDIDLLLQYVTPREEGRQARS